MKIGLTEARIQVITQFYFSGIVKLKLQQFEQKKFIRN